MIIRMALVFAVVAALTSPWSVNMLSRTVVAQKAERNTQFWFIDNVKVIDTSGVCLYVVLGSYDGAPAIAAVPKTQLPQGTGCQ